jgi:hypothetical protein
MMRSRVMVILAAVLVGSWGGEVPAQPSGHSDPSKIRISPQSSTDPLDRPGFIVIRPGGRPPSLGVRQPKSATPVLPKQPAELTNAGLAVPPPNDKLPADTIFDYWFVASVEGQRIGYVHWSAKKVKKEDRELWIGVKYQNFTVSRFGQTVNQWGEESTVEAPTGEVFITGLRQGIGKDQMLILNGIVEGNMLKIQGDGVAKGATDTPWPGGVVGCVREPMLFQQHKQLKIGESFDYLTYVGVVNRVVKMTATLEDEETHTLWLKEPARKLLRYVTKMEPVANFRLPPATTWVDAETREPLKMEFDFPGFGGRVSFLRTTQEAATLPVTRPLELFNAQSIRLDREIPGIHKARRVVYKVTAAKDDDPTTLFTSDGRQEIKNYDRQTQSLELHIRERRGPIKDAAAQPAPGPEFTASNYFINWDNDAVKRHAAHATQHLPAAASAWTKAVAVEKWVHENMKAFEFSQAMATADHVAKTLSGDCTEYAMLAAAMCRAVGVPSRTVLGLVYAPAKDGKPYLAYHMWLEVFAEGQWLPLDPTLALGGVGPGHVKIADHSWHEEKTLAPLLPVLRVLSAKPSVRVLQVEP